MKSPTLIGRPRGRPPAKPVHVMRLPLALDLETLTVTDLSTLAEGVAEQMRRRGSGRAAVALFRGIVEDLETALQLQAGGREASP